MGYISIIRRRSGKTLGTPEYLKNGETTLVLGIMGITYKNNKITIKNLQSPHRRFLVDPMGNCEYDGKEIVPLKCRINQKERRIKNKISLENEVQNIIEINNYEILLI